MARSTEQLDEATLAPMLQTMSKITDLDALKTAAGEFLNKCRFAGDKVAQHKRAIQEFTCPKKIQMFCWNVLLSGEGKKVLK